MPRNRYHLRKIIYLGIPLFAGSFSQYLLQIADTIMVGRLGTEQLAAIAIAGLFTHILHTFIWPLTTGTMAIASRRYGRQVYDAARLPDTVLPGGAEKTGEVLSNGFICAFFSACTALIVSFFSRFIISRLSGSTPLVDNALDYILIVRWMFPFAGISAVITGFLSAVNRTGPVMTVNIGANVLNVFFNYILIFGKAGFPAMGIKGAAAGTLLAEAAGAAYLIYVLLSDVRLKQYKLFNFASVKTGLMRDLLKNAYPPGIQNIVALSVFLIYEAMVGGLGTVYLAAIHIVFSVFRINKTIVGGFARAGAILAGNYLGAGQKDKAGKAVEVCAGVGFAIGLVILFFILLSPSFVAGLFTDDPETLAAAAGAIRFFSVFFFVEVFGYTFEIIFSGIGWGRFVLFSEFTTNMVFILAMTWLCLRVLNLGIFWAWMSFALYQAAHAAILTAGWISGKWLFIDAESGTGPGTK